jgi:choline monooxygenase
MSSDEPGSRPRGPAATESGNALDAPPDAPTAISPLGGPWSLPAQWYWDEHHHGHERRAIFAREWLLVGRADELAEVGAQVPIECAGWPLLLTRSDDGAIRGFHNVCRHRAAPLLDQAKVGTTVRCPYHGWTYDLRGRLRKASACPELVGHSAQLDLVPVRVDIWRGFVFVNLDPAATSLQAVHGQALARANGFAVERFELFGHEIHDLDCNWKTYVDNYAEGYHIPYLHPRLAQSIEWRRYRVDSRDKHSVHVAPAANRAASDGLWLFLFPALALNIYSTGMNIERVLPLGPRKTRLQYSYYFADPGSADAQQAHDLSVQVTREDIAMCERVQRNLEAGVYQVGPLHPQWENGLIFFHQLVRQACESARPAGSRQAAVRPVP